MAQLFHINFTFLQKACNFHYKINTSLPSNPTSAFHFVTKFDRKEKRNEQFVLKFLMRNISEKQHYLYSWSQPFCTIYAPAQ